MDERPHLQAARPRQHQRPGLAYRLLGGTAGPGLLHPALTGPRAQPPSASSQAVPALAAPPQTPPASWSSSSCLTSIRSRVLCVRFCGRRSVLLTVRRLQNLTQSTLDRMLATQGAAGFLTADGTGSSQLGDLPEGGSVKERPAVNDHPCTRMLTHLLACAASRKKQHRLHCQQPGWASFTGRPLPHYYLCCSKADCLPSVQI